ncbi:MAG: hypothetical protein J7501_12080 [Bdellovibrio sp.]|nr:hypothetical protein [Bdellovibrio sp.]
MFLLTSEAFASSWINIDFIRKNAVPIRRMNDDVLILPRTNRVRVGDLIVILRVRGDDVEVIARGAVESVQDNELLATLEGPSITKMPKAKDLVVSLSKLKAQDPDAPIPEAPGSLFSEKPEPYEPGYMVLEAGPYNGHFESQSPNNANQYKIYDFKFVETHFLWYVDFLWRYGIEYQTSGGNIPLKSYNREEQPTTAKETRIALHYRLLPVWKELRPTLKLMSFKSEFQTTNDDEYVVSSSASGIGLGVNLHYLFGDNLYKKDKGFGWSFNRIYADFGYFPSYSVSDTGVQRGTSSSGTMMEFKVGATALFYWSAIPWIKRYSLDISYGMYQSQVTFSGDVKNAADGVYDIPPGQTYSESQTYLKVMFGLRLDDLLSKVMKPR